MKAKNTIASGFPREKPGIKTKRKSAPISAKELHKALAKPKFDPALDGNWLTRAWAWFLSLRGRG